MFTKEHGLNLIDLGNTDLVEDISESHEDLVDVFELFLDCLASTLNNTVEKTSLVCHLFLMSYFIRKLSVHITQKTQGKSNYFNIFYIMQHLFKHVAFLEKKIIQW